MSFTVVAGCLADNGYSPCSGILGIPRWLQDAQVLLQYITAALAAMAANIGFHSVFQLLLWRCWCKDLWQVEIWG